MAKHRRAATARSRGGQRRQWVLLGAGAAAIAVAVVAIVAFSLAGGGGPAAVAEEGLVPPYAHVLGPADASVTIVVFEDFQ